MVLFFNYSNKTKKKASFSRGLFNNNVYLHGSAQPSSSWLNNKTIHKLPQGQNIFLNADSSLQNTFLLIIKPIK